MPLFWCSSFYNLALLILSFMIFYYVLPFLSLYFPSSNPPVLTATPSLPLQACKTNHSAEGGGSSQSLPPHVGTLGQAEDQSCPAKRRRGSSPTKVNKTLTTSELQFRILISPTCMLSFIFIFYCVCVFRMIPGLVIQHRNRFLIRISHHRNYRFALSLFI